MAKNLRITITDRELACVLNHWRRLLNHRLKRRTGFEVFTQIDSKRILEYTKRIQHLTKMHMKHCEK